MAPHESSASHESAVANDRRRRPRINGVTEGWIVPETGDANDAWEVRIHDISRHGVGFESADAMKSGDMVRIRIGRGRFDLARKVRVIRCEQDPQTRTYRIGAEFF